MMNGKTLARLALEAKSLRARFLDVSITQEGKMQSSGVSFVSSPKPEPKEAIAPLPDMSMSQAFSWLVLSGAALATLTDQL